MLGTLGPPEILKCSCLSYMITTIGLTTSELRQIKAQLESAPSSRVTACRKLIDRIDVELELRSVSPPPIKHPMPEAFDATALTTE